MGRGFEMKQKGVSNLVGKVVVVAVRASKEIPRTALVWALTHVAQPGDCIKLIVVVPTYSSSNFLHFLNVPTFQLYYSFFSIFGVRIIALAY